MLTTAVHSQTHVVCQASAVVRSCPCDALLHRQHHALFCHSATVALLQTQEVTQVPLHATTVVEPSMRLSDVHITRASASFLCTPLLPVPMLANSLTTRCFAHRSGSHAQPLPRSYTSPQARRHATLEASMLMIICGTLCGDEHPRAPSFQTIAQASPSRE